MMADIAEGIVATSVMLLAMLVPAAGLWVMMRAYDLIADHRDRQRRRRVRRAMAEATTTSLAEWARKAS